MVSQQKYSLLSLINVTVYSLTENINSVNLLIMHVMQEQDLKEAK